MIEKGKVCGAHTLSGANMKPSAMRELFPDLDPSDWPFAYQEVTKDAVYLLTKQAALPLKPMPPNFRNHGNYVISVSKLSRFLAEQAEEKGAYILTETVADRLLVEDRIVRGIRSGDRGRGKDGEPLGNFEPGSDVVAKTTVLAEGTLGHLTQAALDYFDLHGSLPIRWELGVKEVWEVEKPLDRVIHTMGWPLRKRAKWNEFGGSFIYPMGEDKLCIGLVIGLDYTDSTLSCHDLLQEMKTHPFIKKMLEGGKRVAWGAKTIPSGGYYSMPRSLSVPGMAIAGDAREHGQHPDAEGHPLRDARRDVRRRGDLRGAEDATRSTSTPTTSGSASRRSSNDLFESRNMRQPFSKGFFVGGAVASAMTITKGLFPGGKWEYEPDTEIPMRDGGASKDYPKPDNELTFNKLDSVFLSGNATRDDAPNHVKIQSHVPLRAREDLGQPLPGAGLRDPRRPARERGRRGRRARHRLELRPVRRDQRQGRAADDARGRRRAALPRGLTATPTRVRLRDDSEVVVRPIEPGDKGALVSMFERLSEQSRYQRFMTAVGELSESQLRYLTEVDHHDHEALIAFDADGGDARRRRALRPPRRGSERRGRGHGGRRVAGPRARHGALRAARRARPRGGRRALHRAAAGRQRPDARRARRRSAPRR